MRQRLLLLPLLLAAACVGPQTTVTTPDTRPALAFQGAPSGAVLFVDGRQIGDPRAFDGQPQLLVVEPGTHTVVILGADGAVLLEQKVYLESEHKTLVVH
jgi:hypothetical protein